MTLIYKSLNIYAAARPNGNVYVCKPYECADCAHYTKHVDVYALFEATTGKPNMVFVITITQ